jgi:hypothetical protein
MDIVPSRQLEYTDIIPEVDEVYGYCIEAVNDCDDGNHIIIETYYPSFDKFSTADMNSDGIVDVLGIVILVNMILRD